MDDVATLLEVLNTTPMAAGSRQDHLQGKAGLDWLAAHELPESASERDSLVAARDLIQEAVRGEAVGGELELLLDGVSLVPVLERGALRWDRRLPDEREAASRLVLAYAELERDRPHRLRACASLDCERFLIDQSRANQAKWCSMATCGNRAKARRHYERSRSDL